MSKAYYRQANAEKSDSDKDEAAIQKFAKSKEVDRRRHKVLDLMIAGYNKHDISATLDESIDTIENDMREIKKISFEAREEDLQAVRNEVVASNRQIRKLAHMSYMESKQTQEKTVNENGTKDGKKTEKIKIVEEEQYGDPRFLEVMIKANKQISKDTGARKHKETQITKFEQNNDYKIVSPNREDMPDEFDNWLGKPEDKRGISETYDEAEVIEEEGDSL